MDVSDPDIVWLTSPVSRHRCFEEAIPLSPGTETTYKPGSIPTSSLQRRYTTESDTDSGITEDNFRSIANSLVECPQFRGRTINDSNYLVKGSVLPPIKPQSAPTNVQCILVNNGRLTLEEELNLVQQIRSTFESRDTDKLVLIKYELSDYDPYYAGAIDASTVQRTFAKHFRGHEFPPDMMSSLIRVFAQNPISPRQIMYEKMVQYIFTGIHFKGEVGIQKNGPARTNDKFEHDTIQAWNKRLPMTFESKRYTRGDASLLHGLSNILSHARKLSALDIEDLRQTLARKDALRQGTLLRNQVEDVLKLFGIFNCFEEISPETLEHLCSRCSRGTDVIEWSSFLDFIDKATGGNAHVEQRQRRLESFEQGTMSLDQALFHRPGQRGLEGVAFHRYGHTDSLKSPKSPMDANLNSNGKRDVFKFDMPESNLYGSRNSACFSPASETNYSDRMKCFEQEVVLKDVERQIRELEIKRKQLKLQLGPLPGGNNE